MYGAIEAGGTKFVCVVGTGPDDIRAELRLPTTTPAATLDLALRFFRQAEAEHGRLHALGIGAFGPLDLQPESPTWGYITTTPKAGWAHTDLAGSCARGLAVPVALDTDVNAAALGEWRHGAAQGLHTVVYLTVGTGVGGGAVVHGRLLHGLGHPEMGHVRVRRDAGTDPFAGLCPFHGDCLEGLASGPAIAARWGAAAQTLPPHHPAWTLEARYLGLALHGIVCTLSPQRIVLGGGVMAAPGLLARVRAELAALLGGYVQSPALAGDLEGYVVAPALGSRAGVVGALELARDLAAAQRPDGGGTGGAGGLI